MNSTFSMKAKDPKDLTQFDVATDRIPLAVRQDLALEAEIISSYSPSVHSRERLGKRLIAGRCILMASAALHGRWCGRCSAAMPWQTPVVYGHGVCWRLHGRCFAHGRCDGRSLWGHAMREFFEFK